MTPEQLERDAKRAKAYRKRNPERVKALRDARLARPEVAQKKAECSKRWAERNKALLALRKRLRYHAKKAQEGKA